MKRVLFKSFLVSVLAGFCFYFYYSLPTVSLLNQRNPKTSALMELRAEEYRQKNIRAPRRQVWIAYDAISEHLKKAILVSEDAAFFSHKGVDLDELKAALKKDWET
ncbi:MAG TPA: transglycosylase domain-containing protein, partial [Candidatus Binatia bacterium]